MKNALYGKTIRYHPEDKAWPGKQVSCPSSSVLSIIVVCHEPSGRESSPWDQTQMTSFARREKKSPGWVRKEKL